MKTRKTSLLKWVAMIELVIGAYNLMTGLMSAYVLITDLEGVMASLAESGIEYSAGILGASVAITSIGGLLMVLAGVVEIAHRRIHDLPQRSSDFGIAYITGHHRGFISIGNIKPCRERPVPHQLVDLADIVLNTSAA